MAETIQALYQPKAHSIHFVNALASTRVVLKVLTMALSSA
jgi:hypothetical protein